MTNLITKEVKKLIKSKKMVYSNMDERKWNILEDKLVSEIEEAVEELEEDDDVDDYIKEILYFNSAIDDIIERIADDEIVKAA